MLPVPCVVCQSCSTTYCIVSIGVVSNYSSNLWEKKQKVYFLNVNLYRGKPCRHVENQLHKLHTERHPSCCPRLAITHIIVLPWAYMLPRVQSLCKPTEQSDVYLMLLFSNLLGTCLVCLWASQTLRTLLAIYSFSKTALPLMIVWSRVVAIGQVIASHSVHRLTGRQGSVICSSGKRGIGLAVIKEKIVSS